MAKKNNKKVKNTKKVSHNNNYMMWILAILVAVIVVYLSKQFYENYNSSYYENSAYTISWNRSGTKNCTDFWCGNRPGYAVVPASTVSGTTIVQDKTKFNIQGSPFNTINEAKGLFSQDYQSFGSNRIIPFNSADYVWSSKYSATWNSPSNQGTVLNQNLDDFKGVLYRKSDMVPFSTWVDKSLFSSTRRWGFSTKGQPLAEFSLLSLKLSPLKQV